VYKKDEESFSIQESYWWEYNLTYDIEDYILTSKRILDVKISRKSNKVQNFLLKDRLEDLFLILQELLLRLPKKERYFLREKIERNFLNLLEKVYQYMYQKDQRARLSREFMWDVLVLREFTRFLYMTGRIKNENVYLDLGERWIEICKIVKWLTEKRADE
jgi:hypothetical protein